MSSNYILMIFEGQVTEKDIFENLRKFYLTDNENIIIYGFHCGEIYSLHNKLENDNDLELFALLKEELKDSNTELQNIDREDVSEIYLFFDYDGHAASASHVKLKKMIKLFDNETGDYGKLYISYPMAEAISDINKNIDFKYNLAESNKDYKDLVIKNCDTNFRDINSFSKQEWNVIIDKHCRKANYLVNNKFDFPKKIIEQINILDKQRKKHIRTGNKVAVISSFPIFLAEYYGYEKLKNI